MAQHTGLAWNGYIGGGLFEIVWLQLWGKDQNSAQVAWTSIRVIGRLEGITSIASSNNVVTIN